MAAARFCVSFRPFIAVTVILSTGLIVKAQLKNVEKPEPAALVKAAPEGADWPNEIKFDGYRMHARLDASRVNILSGDERASGASDASAGELIYAARVGTGMGIPKLERVWRRHHDVAAMAADNFIDRIAELLGKTQ